MAVSNSITKAQKQAPFSAVISSEGYKKLINNTLQDPKRANRFVASIISAVATNPQLQTCAPDTIVSAALLGESLELSPSPQLGQFYLSPFNDRKNGRVVAQFIIGYRGYMQLAMRSGLYLDIDTIEIRQGEYKGKNKFNGKPMFEFIEDDDLRESLPVVGYLAYFELLNGFKHSEYWAKAKVINHADTYAPAFSKDKYQDLLDGKIPKSEMWKYSSPWYTTFDKMALKTVLRQLLGNNGPLSIEMQKAFEADNGVLDIDGNVEYLSNQTEAIEAPTPTIEAEVVETVEEVEEQPELLDQEAAQAEFFGE